MKISAQDNSQISLMQKGSSEPYVVDPNIYSLCIEDCASRIENTCRKIFAELKNVPVEAIDQFFTPERLEALQYWNRLHCEEGAKNYFGKQNSGWTPHTRAIECGKSVVDNLYPAGVDLTICSQLSSIPIRAPQGNPVEINILDLKRLSEWLSSNPFIPILISATLLITNSVLSIHSKKNRLLANTGYTRKLGLKPLS